MPALRLFLILASTTITLLSHHAVAKPPKCQAIELHGYQPYDDLVCSGIALMEKKNFSGAVNAFETAMEIPLHEFPNFTLFPRLALAHLYAGNRAEAVLTLSKAELSLMVLTRIIQCDEDGYLVRRDGDRSYKIDGAGRDEVAARMCGAAYDTIYTPQNLSEITGEGRLVNAFLQAKQVIDRDRGRR